MKHLSLKIFGKVQGVFFRSFVKKQAEKEGVFGWVKNNPDGTVSLEVEGEEGVLKKFLEQIEKGSPKAEVKDIWEEWSDDLDLYEKFEVKK
jgi:acylphosphatase